MSQFVSEGTLTLKLIVPFFTAHCTLMDPYGVGTSPCAQLISPGFGLILNLLYPGLVGLTPSTYLVSRA